MFSIKFQTINISGFLGCTISVVTTQIYSYNTKSSCRWIITGVKQNNLFVKNMPVKHILTVGYNTPTSILDMLCIHNGVHMCCSDVQINSVLNILHFFYHCLFFTFQTVPTKKIPSRNLTLYIYYSQQLCFFQWSCVGVIIEP